MLDETVMQELDFEKIYQTFPDMCISLEIQTGKVVDCNETLTKVLGYTKEEVLSSSLFDLYHDSQHDKVVNNLTYIKEGKPPPHSEYIVETKLGELIDVMLKVEFVKDDNGAILYTNAVWRDITEIKKMRKEILNEKERIAAEKRIIEEKNKDFRDAIHYAKNIQQSILPTQQEIDYVLPNSSVFYRPKGIVSGDFYWLYQKDDQVLFAVIDCTGHGVPGALMSMIGGTLLNQIAVEKKLFCTEQIMDEMRLGVIKALHQDGEERKNSDGMDACFCIYDKSLNQIEFTGANNSLVIIRSIKEPLIDSRGIQYEANQINEFHSLYQIKGERNPIGYHDGNRTKFNKKKFNLQSGDYIHLFSDGFQDQIGGPKGKKYLSKKFKQLLLANAETEVQSITQVFSDELESWQGASYEQTYDICIWSLKID